MPEDYASEPAPANAMAPAYAPPRPPRRGGTILLALVVAFLLGAAGVAYAVWQGLIPLRPVGEALVSSAPVAGPSAAPTSLAPAAAQTASLASQQDQLEARVAALSARLDSLTLAAQSAAGDAGRAEALLVAFAARRTLDRGAPLNTLEDQLRLRFGDTQPHAVSTVIEAARQPVTLDQLIAGLDSLAPSLTEAPARSSVWSRLRGELAGLFVIRREATPSPTPANALERARLLLESGRTEEAIAVVERLPGAAGAGDWFTAARRYDDARRALDVLETSAMIGSLPARAGPGTAPGAAIKAPQASGPAA